MLISINELETKLKAKANGVYLFYGEEEYLKRHYLNMFRKTFAADSDFAAFNHTVINGGNIPSFRSELSTLPLLDMFGSGTRLVELRDTCFDKLPKSELEELCQAIKDASDVAAVIYTLPAELPEGTKKKPSPQLAALTAVCSAVNFERQTPQRLVSWLQKHFAANGCFADPETCRFIVEYCTPDMFTLNNEVQKLCAYLNSHSKNKASIPDVRKVCSPQKSFGAFDLSNALLQDDLPAALSNVADMIKHKDRPEEIMARISKIYNELFLIRELYEGGMSQKEIASSLKMNEYALSLKYRAALRIDLSRLEKIVALSKQADAAIKSAPLNKYYIIEEFILQTRG